MLVHEPSVGKTVENAGHQGLVRNPIRHRDRLEFFKVLG